MVMTLVDRRRRGRRPATRCRCARRGVARAPGAGARRDPRRRPWRTADQRPGRHRRRLDRRDRADPAEGRGGQARRVGRAAAAAPRLPGRDLVADGARRRTRRTTRWAGWPSGGSPTRRRPPARQGARRSTPSARRTPPGNTDLAWTRITPWRALLAAALDQQPPKVTGGSVTAERISPSADLLVAWLADRLKVAVEPQELPRPRDHRGASDDQGGPDRDLAPRRPAGDVLLPGPARPAGRPQAP